MCKACRCPYVENKGVCGNKVRDGRRRKQCGADLSDAICMPYRMISIWLADMIRVYGKDKLKEL